MLSQAQLKAKIKRLAKDNHADARILMRLYMMERFLERISQSSYAENFVIKGGILVTSMVGIAQRSTMDIDTSIRNVTLSEEDVLQIAKEISAIDLGDGVTFEIKRTEKIMDDMEYPGIRLSINALSEEMITPIKIDISTGDAITPGAIEYQYRLLLENRSIRLLSYNLETILGEKLQTILSRGVLNTRMRDYYDIYTLLLRFQNGLDTYVFAEAFISTCRKRGTASLIRDRQNIISAIAVDENLRRLWKAYCRKYSYAANISYEDILGSIRKLSELLPSANSDISI
ncbi:MAG: nucleotidyl transferase AbiEii/AbiGii toxin family protein [Lactimicrobium sp.]|jgi:predicted nucleotidyltransferase component of viral defense system|uniref:nucleotidyl transferase AbiEii/AbiGii toxin family protein n=1 Tax=Lactimicrobium sp. TaxID=2563780 RepID=UPI002F35A619